MRGLGFRGLGVPGFRGLGFRVEGLTREAGDRSTHRAWVFGFTVLAAQVIGLPDK